MRTTKLSIYLMSLRFCTCFQYCFARKICKISRALLQISSHLAYQATETTGYFRFTSPSLKHVFLLKVNFFTDTDSLPTRTPGGLVIAVAADAQVRGRPVSVAHGAVDGSLAAARAQLPHVRFPPGPGRFTRSATTETQELPAKLSASQARLVQPIPIVLSFRNVLIAFQTQFLSAADAHSL